MSVETPLDLFEYRLEELYYAENRLVSALDDLFGEVDDDELDEFVREHRGETAEQVERIEAAFEAFGRRPDWQVDPTVDGFADAVRSFLDDVPDGEIRRRYLADAWLTMERVQATRYERLLALAADLDVDEAVVERLEANRDADEAAIEDLESMIEEWAESTTGERADAEDEGDEEGDPEERAEEADADEEDVFPDSIDGIPDSPDELRALSDEQLDALAEHVGVGSGEDRDETTERVAATLELDV